MRRRRAFWVVGVAAALVTVVLAAYLYWPVGITPAEERSGDRGLLDRIGPPEGFRRLSVAFIDLDAAEPVRFAHIGASSETLFEVGSFSKALTGLALADAVRRGEVSLDHPAARHLDLDGSPAGDVTLRELATHHFGLPRLGTRTLVAGRWASYTGGNPYRADTAEVLQEARRSRTSGRGNYEYSNLGAAVTGHAVAAAAGADYRDLMAKRIFAALRMTHTVVAERATVQPGLSARGRTVDPWLMAGYAPAGGVVSTSGELATLCLALLRGNAPGMTALDPIREAGDDDHRIGLFWHVSIPGDTTRMITWHNGRTGGYASFVGLDREQRRAIVVLSDVSTSVDELGVRLLTEPA